MKRMINSLLRTRPFHPSGRAPESREPGSLPAPSCPRPTKTAGPRAGRPWLPLLIAPLLGVAATGALFDQSPTLEPLQRVRIPHPPVTGGWLAGVAWDDHGWVVVGGRGTILRSDDGIEWRTPADRPELCFRNVISGAGSYLTLTHCSTVVFSRDGRHWERRCTPGLPIRGVASGGGVFVGVGDLGTMVVSTDATA